MAENTSDARSRVAPFLSRMVVGWAEAAPEKRWRTVEGTLVYVEVGGFTSLSARLARRGPAGADELARLVSAFFADLLGVSHSVGGTLLKFGGGSLVILFEGVAHAARGCRAGRQMQAAVGRAGLIPTSVGSVQPSVAVGVHSGAIDMFRVGRSHRELVVAGPAASQAVAMASVANHGEVVISPETVLQLGPGQAGETRGPGYLLRHSPAAELAAAIGAFPPALEVGLDLTTSIPAGLRDHIVSGQTTVGHRYATIGVVRFEGLDTLLADCSRAAAAAALDEFVGDVQHAVDIEGVCFLGTEVDRDGGRMVLVAGAPVAVDGGEARMLRALRTIGDAPAPLSVRVGVRRGHVFVGPVGPECRRAYIIVGDAYDIASAGAAAGA
jgi:class 3 adenylate cyclase